MFHTMEQSPDYTITTLNISRRGLTELPADIMNYTNLIELYCDENKLTHILELPQTLKYLSCHSNKLKKLPDLSSTKLEFLFCNRNKLSELPPLPRTLIHLNCHDNLITDFSENLFENVDSFWCCGNPLIYDFKIQFVGHTQKNEIIQKIRQFHEQYFNNVLK